jgi:CheY-like chemotaxis protein
VVLRHLLSNALKFSQRAADAAVVIRVAVRAAPPLPSASSSTSASAASSRAASEDEACEDAPSQPLLLPQPAHARALAPASAATLEVCVCDRGVGVSAATEARLFRLFEQGDAGFARAYEGLGIGLSLSAALARLMGGRLGFQRPADGVGSIFALSVPVQLAPTAQPAPLRRVVVAPSDAAPRPLPLALLRAPEDACYADHLAVAAHALSPDARVAQFGSFDALRAAAEDAVAAARGAPLLVLVACEFGDEPLAVLRELLRSLGARDAAVLRARLPGRGAAASEEEAAAAAAAAAAAGARRALSASLAPASARRAFSFSPVSAGAPRGARCLAAAECPSLCEPAARLRSDAGAEAGGGEGGGGGGGGEEDADEEGEEEEGEEEDGDIYANSPEASPRLRRDPVVLLPASARSLQRAAAAAMRRARAPAAAAAGDGAGAGAGAGEAATPLRVLVVEDNAVNRKVVCKMVERAGHAAATAENGAECLRYLATLRARDECDLVLMDLHMPVMDGLEAARRIRADRASPFADVHIAALTAAVTTETRQLCRESGMQDFFGKPFERAALEALFSRLARAKLEDRWRRAAKAPPPPTPPLQLQPAPFARRRPPPLSPISRPSSATCGGSGSGAACASGGGGQGLGGAAPLL